VAERQVKLRLVQPHIGVGGVRQSDEPCLHRGLTADTGARCEYYPFLAWIGSPCLRHCVHGDSIKVLNATRQEEDDAAVEAVLGGGQTAQEVQASQVSQKGQLLSRRGCGFPANASAFDTHRRSIQLTHLLAWPGQTAQEVQASASAAAATRAGGGDAARVSPGVPPLLACVGSPCLRHCVRGA
jgi:hypothetical protein